MYRRRVGPCITRKCFLRNSQGSARCMRQAYGASSYARGVSAVVCVCVCVTQQWFGLVTAVTVSSHYSWRGEFTTDVDRRFCTSRVRRGWGDALM